MFELQPVSQSPVKKALASWLEWWIPRTSKKKVYNFRGEPQFAANLMDVDRLRAVLAAAEVGDTRDLFALYRDVMISDSHLQTEFGKRKLAVLGDPISIQPRDKTNPDDVKAQQAIQDMIDGNKENFIHACNHLLDGHLWPVALLEKTFRSSRRAGLRFELDKLVIVPHLDLDYTSGFLQLWELDPSSGYISGQREAPNPNRYMVHRGHLLQMADFWGGPFRSLLFWWLLGANDRDWWARFLDRYGAPFIVGKYDPSDDAARAILARAFQAATKIFGLVVSKSTEVDLVEAASSQTGEAFKSFLDVCNDEKSKLILGQTSSAKQAEGGLSNGGNKQHESVRQDIRQYDQLILSLTIEQQLFRQYLDINGFVGSTPRLIWGGVSSEEQTSLGDLILKLKQAGYELTDGGLSTLSERIAFPLQRASVAAPVPGPFSVPLALTAGDRLVTAGHVSIDRVAASGAADLSQAFRGSLAPIRRIIAESRSAAECEMRVKEFYADWRPDKLAGLIGEALEVYAANGAASRGQ
jgi:hypothetical protein